VILVDTSVWVDHLRRGDPALVSVLEAGEVAIHPFVIGEIACGRLSRRREILALLDSLPGVEVASHDEVLVLVETHGLAGAGIGWVDAHLLAAAALARVPVWTRDRRLLAAATRLRSAYTPG